MWLLKTGKITITGISAIGDMLEQAAQLIPKGSIVDQLIKYAQEAVGAVEQWVINGKLEKVDKVRKETAKGLVLQYAAADGVNLSLQEKALLDSIIDAEVGYLPPTSERMAVKQTSSTDQIKEE
jgi:hypothetical protein